MLLAMARAGRCPCIASLLDEGAVVDVVSPYGTFVGSVWMTFMTGRRVGNHGYWNWACIDPVTYEPKLTTPLMARGRPFWESMSDAGRRVAVLDVPHSRVPRSHNGIVL